MSRGSASRALAVATLASALLAGCAAGDARSSPASAAPRHRAQCIVSDAQGQFMVQPGTVSAGAATRTLTDVSLTNAVNLSVIRLDVVPFAGNPTAHGVLRDYPPLPHADIADGLAHWADRRPLRGLTIDADDANQAVLVSLRLTDPTRPGHLDGTSLSTSSGDIGWSQPLLVEPHRALRLCTLDEVDSSLDWVPAP